MTDTPSTKTFEDLFLELSHKLAAGDTNSASVRLVEEAAEVWMAAEHEGKEALALEISQLIYHLEILMHAHELSVQDIYKNL